MDKFILACLCSLGVSPFWGFEKLDTKYQISYGSPNSPVKVVEYFSMSCVKCFDFFQEDFQHIKRKYIESGDVLWVFHPDPADLLTLQAMVCLEHLNSFQKPIFLEAVFKHIREKKHRHGCIVMQAVMEVLGQSQPSLSEIDYLEKTEAFRNAFLFLRQKDVPKSIPIVEINGKILDEYPTKESLEREFSSLLRRAS